MLVQVVIRSESFASFYRHGWPLAAAPFGGARPGGGLERLRRGGSARRFSSKRGKETERKNWRARRRGVIGQRSCVVSGQLVCLKLMTFFWKIVNVKF